MGEAIEALRFTRPARRRIAIDVPDIVSGTDLADRLRGYSPLLSSTGGDGCRLTIPDAPPAVLRPLLSTVQDWARYWELDAVPIGIGGRAYRLGGQPKPAVPALRRPKLVFFYSPRSGHCRRAEALLAQVLQRRRNHDTFELVRVAVDARPDLAERFAVDKVPAIVVLDGRRVAAQLGSLQHSHEIEAALGRWLR